MDTKLKNTDNLKLKRIIAAALAILFFFISGFGVFCFVRDTVYYNRLSSTGDYPEYSGTNVFRQILNECEYRILSDGEYLSCENLDDYLKTSAGKELQKTVKEGAANIKAACDYLDGVKGLEVSVTRDNKYRYRYRGDDGNYYFSFNGNLISADEYNELDYIDDYYDGEYYEDTAFDGDFNTDAYEEETSGKTETTTEPTGSEDESRSATSTTAPQTENKAEDVTSAVLTTGYPGLQLGKNKITNIGRAIGLIWKTTRGENTNGINYGEMSTEQIIKKYTDERLPQSFTPAVHGDYYDLYMWSDVIKSVNFAVFYNTTGKVATNCAVKPGDDTKTVLSKIGEDYYEYYENGKYVSSADQKANNSYAVSVGFEDSPVSTVYRQKNIDRIYVGWDMKNSGAGDPFIVSRTAFEGNIHSHAKIGSETAFLVIAIISFILACACSMYVISKAGITSSGEAALRFADKIPLMIRAGIAAAFMTACGVFIGGIHYYEFKPQRLFIFNSFPPELAKFIAGLSNQICALLFAAFCAAGLALICSMARNIRTKTFFRYTLVNAAIRIIKFIIGKICGLFSKIKTGITKEIADDYANGKGRKFLIFSGIAICAAALIGVILFTAAWSDGARVIGIIGTLLLAAYAALLAVSFHRIAKGIGKIKEGKFNNAVNTALMPPFMKAVAENISSVRDGVQAAVNQAMREQATRTELLTNVTHDLKTPLTSIITYVDLLKKTDDPAEREEYLSVLDDKSQRLKKLIDDLVQASKAASGNVEVNPIRLNLCEFAAQIIGENEDELREQGIALVSKIPSDAVYVNADSNITNRIFENLLSNIKKYALKGTRAYIEVTSGENYGLILFKNISSAPLEADAEKFTERFFRGDTSRTGEGNGLGLSIASNLCTAQGGTFKIETDGDLFKAMVTIPKAD